MLLVVGFNGVAPEIPKPKTVGEAKEEEEPKEEEKKEAASIATVEKKARFNPLAAVYSNIENEEPPPYEFLSTLPELYSLDLDIIRLTAQYTAVNGRKVHAVSLPSCVVPVCSVSLSRDNQCVVASTTSSTLVLLERKSGTLLNE